MFFSIMQPALYAEEPSMWPDDLIDFTVNFIAQSILKH